MSTDESTNGGMRERYRRRMQEIRAAFDAGATGAATIAARARALDEFAGGLWAREIERDRRLSVGSSLVAIGGYGRAQLFPYSDVDLLFLLDGRLAEKDVKDAIRRVNQEMWDAGIRISPATRRLAECERFDAENTEFAISLMDHRPIAGDAALYKKLARQTVPKMLYRERRGLMSRLMELTSARHAKYGQTIFHLEPNIKDCPGGLRDVHVWDWMTMLRAIGANGNSRPGGTETEEHAGFREAVEFLWLVRCFLHYRHERDDNALDWHAQDAAAARGIGLGDGAPADADAAYWMRFYFRHARRVEHRVARMLEDTPQEKSRLRLPGFARERRQEPSAERGFHLEHGRAVLAAATPESDPAQDPEIVLGIFETMAHTGCTLEETTERRLAGALPMLSAYLEEGPALWQRLQRILTGRYAGNALRTMHVLGVLELLVPEFHGIDALVVRDAYHRYTVDEHTFVLIDTLHGLEREQSGPMAEWASQFARLLRELPHPGLLYLAALMHDTGKGRSTGNHAQESMRMAESVLKRLELDPYESGMVSSLIANHLEMSAAIRRDIFDRQTIRMFAARVQTPEMLRMLTLFTYADIQAVHPDALTPWKAENLWRLYIATSNYLDRNVDEDRIGARKESELVHRVAALRPGRKTEIEDYLEGFPERYVLTRTPEQIRSNLEMASRLSAEPVQLDFRYAPGVSELTLVTPDRALLFANMTGALAAWGLNIVTAEAFSNRRGIVVDSFRFTDSFRTLEMNASEHERFVESVRKVMNGEVPVEMLLSGRRRARRKPPKVLVEPRVEFDNMASSHSTLIEVVTQDTTGLLHSLSLALAHERCNIEVALIDTEGEMAIDVFYLTRDGKKLNEEEERSLREALLRAMEENVHF